MAINLSRKKPNFGNARSHALNSSRKKQKVNLQKVKINGKTVLFSAQEIKTLKKNQKAA